MKETEICTLAYRKDLPDVLPGCFAVFWGIRRA